MDRNRYTDTVKGFKDLCSVAQVYSLGLETEHGTDTSRYTAMRTAGEGMRRGRAVATEDNPLA